MDLIINHETDDDILDDDSKILADVGIGAQSLMLVRHPELISLVTCRERDRGLLLQPGTVRRVQEEPAAGMVNGRSAGPPSVL